MPKHYHLLGICGTAMASLAGLLMESGFRVCGSDQNVYPPMSTFLEQLGIPVQEGYRPENLVPRPDLVVVGNAIPRGNPELEAALNQRIPYASMPEVIKDLYLRSRRPIVVTGTHGKTTVTSMISWLLHQAGLNPGFLIGGIAENFSSSYRVGLEPFFVIEGDEYDTAYFDKRAKFHHYLPECLIINHLEYDHADIYPNIESMLLEFRRLVNIVPSGGLILADAHSPRAMEVCEKAHCRVETFGIREGGDWGVESPDLSGERSSFTITRGGLDGGRHELPMAGLFNVKNALAAAAAASWAGLTPTQIAEGLASFKGVKRRLQLRGVRREVSVYDDFAHHPTAIRATLEAVAARVESGRVWALFEPRSWTSRRNIHQERFPWAFEPADVTIVARVFQADKVPAAIRLDPQRVVADLKAAGKTAFYCLETEEIIEKVARGARPGDTVIVMSNGGFDGIHERLLAALAP